ncbi:asparagine synthase (glutamine-hydrolyzing) [Marinoscillum sp. MHG1-6]|uniref:asparagine synthase (glutamine-hydrolyzing) n=1 Tax=Marinoscillum sp. MHG1-6 TaxID=2959627 RepID=UPI002157DD50|nr:asparagine synthase (glutamine-hydrolyzing) [Marinoscillum sp. MHG1-6]
MCGITGIFAFNPIGRMHLIHLEEATRILAKRGPDAHQTWFDEVVGLGHRRLSIIDTSEAANQPMKDSTGRYTIVFNGEVYNFRELKKELSDQGVSFTTTSDTEVLLYAYIIWGKQCVERLNGFFAFAIYDAEAKRLFAARDRYGIKPFYYHADENRVLFASELKSLMAFGVPKELDKESLHLYFQLTYIPAPHTIFKGVQKLRPGHSLSIENGEALTEAYYSVPYREKPAIQDFDAAKNQLERALRQSVHDRLVSDVPLGAFLSGGIDSSIIVALASEQIKDLKTYSIGFRDNKYFDETAYAELVAKKYHTDHHTFSLTNDDLLQEVQGVLDYIDEPFADSSALPVSILSRKTREHVTVALSGDGADELFSGYNKHSAWLLSHQKSKSNWVVSAASGLWKVLPKSRYTAFADTIRKLDKYARLLNLSHADKYWFLASFVEDQKISRLLTSDQSSDPVRLAAIKGEILKNIRSEDINEVLLTDSQLVLEGDMLTKVDRMSMANSLEVRVPFLDPAVVELAFNMPGSFKISESGKKKILRETFKDYLPAKLYTRPKHGFEVPLLDWFKRELKGKLNEMVFDEEKIREQGVFEWNEVKRIRQKLYSFDPGDIHVQVWSLLVFQNWYDKYFS